MYLSDTRDIGIANLHSKNEYRGRLKNGRYLVYVSREADGSLRRVPVPFHLVWMVAAAAVIGLFTVAGLAGSYSRMLLKTERFNQLRREHEALRGDYARLEKKEHEKEVQAASLGALASEVSALYGLTARGVADGAQGSLHFIKGRFGRAKSPGTQPIAQIADTSSDTSFNNASYYKSVSDFYALRSKALDGSATRSIGGLLAMPNSLRLSDGPLVANMPSLWPLMGPITSPFGAREDPMLGSGEGEFHKGVDISAPYGTPIRATGDGIVVSAAVGNGYGKEVVIDHGGGVHTIYAHMSGFHVSGGDAVARGQIIGYVGLTGRSTGAHVHYEVRLRDVPVNPHKYMRDTLNDDVVVASR